MKSGNPLLLHTERLCHDRNNVSGQPVLPVPDFGTRERGNHMKKEKNFEIKLNLQKESWKRLWLMARRYGIFPHGFLLHIHPPMLPCSHTLILSSYALSRTLYHFCPCGQKFFLLFPYVPLIQRCTAPTSRYVLIRYKDLLMARQSFL